MMLICLVAAVAVPATVPEIPYLILGEDFHTPGLAPCNPPEFARHLHVLHDEAVDGHAHGVGVHLARRVLRTLGLHFV